MTLAQQIEQRGEQRGMQLGAHQNAVQIAYKMLKDGMEIDLVQKYSGLSEDEIVALQQKI